MIGTRAKQILHRKDCGRYEPLDALEGLVENFQAVVDRHRKPGAIIIAAEKAVRAILCIVAACASAWMCTGKPWSWIRGKTVLVLLHQYEADHDHAMLLW